MNQREWIEECSPSPEEREEMQTAVLELMERTGDSFECCFDSIIN